MSNMGLGGRFPIRSLRAWPGNYIPWSFSELIAAACRHELNARLLNEVLLFLLVSCINVPNNDLAVAQHSHLFLEPGWHTVCSTVRFLLIR